MPIKNREGFLVYNNQLDAFDLYHIVQEEAEHEIAVKSPNRRDGGPLLPALGHAVSGAIASALAKAALYPIDIVVCRLQVQSQMKGKKETPSAARDADAAYKGVLDAARKIFRTEGGIGAFYTGCGVDVAKGFIDSFLFFLAYTVLRKFFTLRARTKSLPVGQEIGVGVIAGCISKAVTSPIQNIVTRQQTAALYAARDPTFAANTRDRPHLSIKDIALQIRAERGLAGFWAGYSAAVILTLNPAITFAVDNFLHRLLPRSQRDHPGPTLTFLTAATSKAVATAITYPVMLAKSRAQAAVGPQSSESQSAPARGKGGRSQLQSYIRALLSPLASQAAILHSLQHLARTEGLTGLYSGLEGEVVKGFLQHGLTMVLKENVHGSVIQTYYLLLKLTKRWPAALSPVNV